jgi:phage FluMu protein gp41
MQKQHEREMRELILQDKARAEAETEKVREELVRTSAKVRTCTVNCCCALSIRRVIAAGLCCGPPEYV